MNVKIAFLQQTVAAHRSINIYYTYLVSEDVDWRPPPVCWACYQIVVCPSCLSVCNVGVLWPNGWMDQDETWHAGRPRRWPHCVEKSRPVCTVFGKLQRRCGPNVYVNISFFSTTK